MWWLNFRLYLYILTHNFRNYKITELITDSWINRTKNYIVKIHLSHYCYLQGTHSRNYFIISSVESHNIVPLILFYVAFYLWERELSLFNGNVLFASFQTNICLNWKKRNYHILFIWSTYNCNYNWVAISLSINSSYVATTTYFYYSITYYFFIT